MAKRAMTDGRDLKELENEFGDIINRNLELMEQRHKEIEDKKFEWLLYFGFWKKMNRTCNNKYAPNTMQIKGFHLIPSLE